MQDTFSITYGDQAENHVGMHKLGELAESGFKYSDCTKKLKEKNIDFEVIKLHKNLPETEDILGCKAYVIIIRNGVNILLDDPEGATQMYEEQKKQKFDKTAFMKGRVVNKRARWNSCFAEEGQEPDIANGKGTVVPFKKVPHLDKLRKILPQYFGLKASDLLAEMNYYYDPKNCGIGFHGDSERRKVICARLGASLPMHFQWFKRFKPIGNRVKFTLNHGDLYIMSEKAVGTDWKKSYILTLRHAAGCDKYTTIKEK